MTYNRRPVIPALPNSLPAKRAAALEHIRREVPDGLLAVAFSGGVDSTLLLALALEALGPARVLAVTAASESLPASELSSSRELCTRLGARHEVVRTRELARPGYVENAGDRCYHCKSELFEVVASELSEPVAAVAYGATLDDLGDYRPGLQAAAEAGALAPLVAAGLGKEEIRDLSRELGLPNWDKPAHPCLASRVPHGERVTASKLSMIEAAERALRGAGFADLRVRHHELETPGGKVALARIELPLADLPRFVGAAREEALERLRALGYALVTLDLAGFRSGSLNEVLPEARRLPRAKAFL